MKTLIGKHLTISLMGEDNCYCVFCAEAMYMKAFVSHYVCVISFTTFGYLCIYAYLCVSNIIIHYITKLSFNYGEEIFCPFGADYK